MGAPSMFLPDQVEAAVVARLNTALTGVQVATMGSKDFNDDGQLVMDMPAVRVRFNGAPYESRDAYALTYQTEQEYEIWCAAEDLRGSQQQRTAALLLADQVMVAIAGQKLALQDSTFTEPVFIRGVSRLEDDDIGFIYIVTVAIGGIAQFVTGGS